MLVALLLGGCLGRSITIETGARATAASSTKIELRPGNRVLRSAALTERTDTITLLLRPSPDSAPHVHAVLVRERTHVRLGTRAGVREVQHYRYASGATSDDTLDVDAATLAPARYRNVSAGGGFDVRIAGTQLSGWRSDSTGARTPVREEAPQPFFVSIMTEGFIEAFPFARGAVLRVPTANPPSPVVREIALTVSGEERVRTASGSVDCLVIAGPGRTTTWVDRADGHLVRMRWVLPNGGVVTKLPSRDVAFVDEEP